jgi:hypothetical protein
MVQISSKVMMYRIMDPFPAPEAILARRAAASC